MSERPTLNYEIPPPPSRTPLRERNWTDFVVFLAVVIALALFVAVLKFYEL